MLCVMLSAVISPLIDTNMKFKVTQIEFDFEDEFGEWTQHHFDNVTADTLETIWEADDEDDLIEEITCATGWCIKSIDYVHVLN